MRRALRLPATLNRDLDPVTVHYERPEQAKLHLWHHNEYLSG